MNKFLERQHKAMLMKEGQKLAEYNLGKLKTQKKTLNEFVKPDYAYSQTINFDTEGDESVLDSESLDVFRH